MTTATATATGINEHFNVATHNGCVTMTNPATGQHRTLRIKTQKDDANFAPGERVLSLMTGSDNCSDFRGFAFVKPDGRIFVWRKHRADSKFAALADMLTRPLHYVERFGVEYDIEGRCRRCNRKLTVPESVRSGIGPVCVGL